MPDKLKPSIAELEALIADDSAAIEILPDGSIRTRRRRRKAKPLTFRRQLGGEYGVAA